MAKHFTDAETAAWLKTMPKKPLSGKIIFHNEAGQLLVVKPNYKPGWSFVGGMVDANESPLQAAIRETKEEIGLEIPASRLTFLGVRYGISKRSGDDYVHFLFKATLTSPEINSIVLKTDELDGLKWISQTETDPEMTDNTYKFALKLLRGEIGAYSEDDNFEL